MINFKTFLISLSMFNSYGHIEEKLKLAFRIHDFDNDDIISRSGENYYYVMSCYVLSCIVKFFYWLLDIIMHLKVWINLWFFIYFFLSFLCTFLLHSLFVPLYANNDIYIMYIFLHNTLTDMTKYLSRMVKGNSIRTENEKIQMLRVVEELFQECSSDPLKMKITFLVSVLIMIIFLYACLSRQIFFPIPCVFICFLWYNCQKQWVIDYDFFFSHTSQICFFPPFVYRIFNVLLQLRTFERN